MNCFRTSEKIKVGNKKKDEDFADALIFEKSNSICHQEGDIFYGLFTFDVALLLDGSKEPK